MACKTHPVGFGRLGGVLPAYKSVKFQLHMAVFEPNLASTRAADAGLLGDRNWPSSTKPASGIPLPAQPGLDDTRFALFFRVGSEQHRSFAKQRAHFCGHFLACGSHYQARSVSGIQNKCFGMR